MNARMDNATALKVSLALTDAAPLPPRQFSFESPKEHRARAARIKLMADYRQARNEWWTLCLVNRSRWCGLGQDGLDGMEGAFERAVELRNELYGTEF